MRERLTTAEAAEAVGIARHTLQRWIRERSVSAPKATLRDGRGVRLWSDTDVEKLRKYKQENYRKGRGRKPKPKR
jgi:excisionase family DNA binding protein